MSEHVLGLNGNASHGRCPEVRMPHHGCLIAKGRVCTPLRSDHTKVTRWALRIHQWITAQPRLRRPPSGLRRRPSLGAGREGEISAPTGTLALRALRTTTDSTISPWALPNRGDSRLSIADGDRQRERRSCATALLLHGFFSSEKATGMGRQRPATVF